MLKIGFTGLVAIISSQLAAGTSPGDIFVTEFTAGRSSSGSVFVGVSTVDRVCSFFGALRDDWVMELEGSTLVVRYGDRSSLEDVGNCGFGPLVVPQWPGLQVALSAEKFVGAVPEDVTNVRLEFARQACEEPEPAACNPVVVRQVLAETTIQSLPRSAARLESGAWRPDPGVGVLGRPGPSMQVREDHAGLAFVWIGGGDGGGPDWVFSGGPVGDAAAALPAFAPISGGCRTCRVPDMDMALLEGSFDVWIRGTTEVWISLPGTMGFAMEAWRPWAIRKEISFGWFDDVSFPDFGGVMRNAQLADLTGEWIDVDRQLALADGRITVQPNGDDVRADGWSASWIGGSGSIRCGDRGICTFTDDGSDRELQFRISGVGAENIYSPQVPCRSTRTCDALDGGLFLVRGG